MKRAEAALLTLTTAVLGLIAWGYWALWRGW